MGQTHRSAPHFNGIELVTYWVYISRLEIGFKSPIDWALILPGEMV